MNKNQRDQTQFSPEKRPWKKENGFAVYLLCAITQTKKQTIGL